jgi:hypothetical protein
LVEDQIFWENRKEYIQILDFFVSKKLALSNFSSKRSNQKLEEEIFVRNSNEIDINVNPKCFGFTKLIYFIYSLAEMSDDEISLEMNLEQPQSLDYVISEEYFRLKIEEYFLPKLKKYCEKF